MGLIDYLKNIFSGGADRKERYINWYNGSAPVFSSFGNDIYLSDFVNNAIARIASEVAKVDVKSVVETMDGNVAIQNDEITRLFRDGPNPLQTASDFLSSVEWLRRKNCNAFIYPTYEVIIKNGRTFRFYTGFYPLDPSEIQIGTTSNGAVWELSMRFPDGSRYQLLYQDLIHLRWRRGKNLILGGGDDMGQPDVRDTLRTINSLDKVIQGLPKSIEASLQIKGVYQAKTVSDQLIIQKMRDDFESHIMTSKTGIVATDFAGEFVPIKFEPAAIEKETINFLKLIVQERYGVSAAILSGDFNGEQHGAFYQTAIEEFLVEFEQGFSRCLYSQRERDLGHKVKGYYSKTAYLSTESKLKLADLAKSTGIMSLNQINDMFGIPPFPDGNRRLQSLNYVNLTDIDAYQKKRADAGKVSEEN